MRKLHVPLLFVFILFGCSSGEEEPQSEPVSTSERTLSEADAAAAEIIEAATFTDLDGNEVTLADYRGKVLLIDFWETWCGPCLQVFPTMNQLRQEYPEDFEVLAVTLGLLEGKDEARAFREENGYDFDFLYDEYNVSDQLGIDGIPYKIFIDPEGNMIKRVKGLDLEQGDYESTKALITEYRVEQ